MILLRKCCVFVCLQTKTMRKLPCVNYYVKRTYFSLISKSCWLCLQCDFMSDFQTLCKPMKIPKLNFYFFAGHRCYVCAPNTRKFADIQELKKMFGSVKIPKCSHYHRYRMQEFIQECPKESRGCVTQFEGKTVF